MGELKPCPFCGGEAKVESIKDTYAYHVRCQKCGINTGRCISKANAINKWNTRTEPDARALTLEELREMDGKPVFLHMIDTGVKCWAILMEFSSAGYFVRFNGGQNDMSTKDYGKTWFAYDKEPKGE